MIIISENEMELEADLLSLNILDLTLLLTTLEKVIRLRIEGMEEAERIKLADKLQNAKKNRVRLSNAEKN